MNSAKRDQKQYDNDATMIYNKLLIINCKMPKKMKKSDNEKKTMPQSGKCRTDINLKSEPTSTFPPLLVFFTNNLAQDTPAGYPGNVLATQTAAVGVHAFILATFQTFN